MGPSLSLVPNFHFPFLDKSGITDHVGLGQDLAKNEPLFIVSIIIPRGCAIMGSLGASGSSESTDFAMKPAETFPLTDECHHYQGKNEVPWDIQK